MQPCSREMQMAFQELQNGSHHPINDDFLDQMLSSLPSWPDLDGTSGGGGGSGGGHFAPFDESALLASRLRQHQISGGRGSDGGGGEAAAGKAVGFHQLSQQQQMILSSMGRSPTAGGVSGGGGGGEQGLLPLPVTLGSNGGGLVDRSRDDEDTTSFKSPNSAGGSEGLFNGFGMSLQQQQQHFINQAQTQGESQNFVASSAATGGVGGGGAPATATAPRQRVRARRGQATDPHSIAERLRRERIAERMKALQELVPNANKTDKASMLDEIIDYVKFLQLQVKVLSMSRLGGAAAVAPLVADISSEHSGRSAPAANDSLTVTEQQVAKLMEEDMGSAMQYLQGKGLCLMPISLASAISTSTCHPRAGSSSAATGGGLMNASFLSNPNGDGPSSPSLSVLTVQSAVAGGTDSVKEAASVSKP